MNSYSVTVRVSGQLNIDKAIDESLTLTNRFLGNEGADDNTIIEYPFIGGDNLGHWPTSKEIFENKNESLYNEKVFDPNKGEYLADVIRIKNIHFKQTLIYTQREINKFTTKYLDFLDEGYTDISEGQKFLATKKLEKELIDLGLIKIIKNNLLTKEEQKDFLVKRYNDEQTLLYKPIEAIPRKKLENMFSTLSTTCISSLDIGEIKFTFELNENKNEYENYLKWIKSGDKNDWVVCIYVIGF